MVVKIVALLFCLLKPFSGNHSAKMVELTILCFCDMIPLGFSTADNIVVKPIKIIITKNTKTNDYLLNY